MQDFQFTITRKLVMLVVDVALITVAYFLAIGLVLPNNVLAHALAIYSGMLPLIIVVFEMLLQINGLYTIEHKRFAEILLSIFVTCFCAWIVVMALSFFIRDFSYSRGVLTMTLVLTGLFLSFWRYLTWRFIRHFMDKRKVLLLGSEEECLHVYNRLKLQPQLNMKLAYIATDMENDNWKKAAEQVDVIIMAPEMRHRYKVQVINYCLTHGKQPLLLPNTFEIFCSGASLDKIDDIPVFRLQNLHPSLEVRTLKRILDIVVALIGFICALPFMIATAIAIKVTDPGPIFYSQVRTGRDGKPFKVHKFRTMRVDAEKYSGPMLATENDPRITKTGKFLRAVRLDELPQIWNVLNGDMSIVGPRPERPFFVEKFIKEMPEYAYRHNVKPGITGMAQVYGKYNTTAFDKLVYDLMYIQHCNVLTDLVIIIQTVKVLFTKSATEGAGAHQETKDLSKYNIDNDIYGDF